MGGEGTPTSRRRTTPLFTWAHDQVLLGHLGLVLQKAHTLTVLSLSLFRYSLTRTESLLGQRRENQIRGSNLEDQKMESVPGEVWHQILQIGIETERLNYTDLCSLAIVNSYFNQMTQDYALWDILISRDFGTSFVSIQAPPKARYRWKHSCGRALKEQLKTCCPGGFPQNPDRRLIYKLQQLF